MNKEELKYYKENNKRIVVILKNNFRYTGKIYNLFDNSFQFEDRYEGMITIPYEEIRVITELKSKGVKNGL